MPRLFGLDLLDGCAPMLQNRGVEKWICNTVARIIGYERGLRSPSTDGLQALGCDEVFTDARAGSSVMRPGFDQALGVMKPGDVLAVTRLGAIAHDVRDLGPILLDLKRRGLHLVSRDDDIDTRKDAGRFFRFAATLVNLQLEATTERRQRAEEAAKTAEPGRPQAITDEAWSEVEPLIRSGNITQVTAADRLGVDRTTVFRRLKTKAA